MGTAARVLMKAAPVSASCADDNCVDDLADNEYGVKDFRPAARILYNLKHIFNPPP